MSKTTKKVTAVLLALLLAVQAVPVLADSTYSSGTIVGSQKGYREALEIVASKGTYVLLDQTLLLDVNEGYQPVWSSENESIATVDKTGLVTAVAPGEVKITAEAEGQKATAVVTVIDPEPLMADAEAREAEKAGTEEPAGEPTEEPVEEPTEEPVEEPVEEPTEEPAEEPTEEPVEEPTEEPVEEPTEEPAEEPTEEPSEEPVEEPVEEPTEEPVEEPTEEPVEEPTEEPTEEPVEEPTEEPVEEPVPVKKEFIVVVINAESSRHVYDGEEHVLDSFVATSNTDHFDASKIRVSGAPGIRAVDCGTYEFVLDESSFSYDDPNVVATFVVHGGWMRITPAQVTVTANEASKQEGEADPELTATVVGLYGEDTVAYNLERMPGEKVGEYIIDAYGDEQQGNYRVSFVPGKFSIHGKPVVTIESSIPEGQAVYSGTEITLKAITAGFGDAELAYQWQWSTDGEHWNDLEGETKKTYTYIITYDNANYMYRVCVDPVE